MYTLSGAFSPLLNSISGALSVLLVSSGSLWWFIPLCPGFPFFDSTLTLYSLRGCCVFYTYCFLLLILEFCTFKNNSTS